MSKIRSKVPCVSIGLPVYNAQAYLRESLDSILTQTFEDFELIISDNASTDKTREICREYADKDPRIRFYPQEINRGAAFNMNRVMELSRGKYFKLAADDDICGPDYLKHCVEVFDRAPCHVVLCYPKTILIDGDGREIKRYEDRMDIRFRKSSQRLRWIFQNLRLCNVILGLIRTRALKATRLHGNYPHADVVLLCELVLQGEIWEVPDYLFFRRIHAGSSHQENRNVDEIAAWFDPANKGKHAMPRCKMFLEIFKAIKRSSLSKVEKSHCCFVLINHWISKYWRTMGGEIKIIIQEALFSRNSTLSLEKT